MLKNYCPCVYTELIASHSYLGLVISITVKMQHYKTLIEKKVGFVCLKFGAQLVRGFQNANLYTKSICTDFHSNVIESSIRFKSFWLQKVLGRNLNAFTSSSQISQFQKFLLLPKTLILR